jgi:hypothetical protein
MSGDIPASDAKDDELQARLNEARKRYVQDPTPENRKAHATALKALTDWVVRGSCPRIPSRPQSH